MRGSQYNEREIVARIAKGDESAFAVFFRHHYQKIYEVGLMLTQTESVAEELVQDVFLKVWKQQAQLPDIMDIPSWLFIIARNDAYKALRRSTRLKVILDTLELPLPVSNETDEQIIYRNYHELVNKAVSQLPLRQQTAWRLSREEGLKREEIAARMQIRPDTVKEHLSLAVKNIRSFLEAHDAFLIGAELIFISTLHMLN
ncbi:RNA polymerase sigma-70 factor, ECF subfamily [Chitinophaga eiseniae]|uniref:RNA polymerase sigma factor n=1 Tax=Chitinophaga eiseniae TaxID=634771 RepID=A0A1T4TZ24_9BACT|nr:sigma-70 family RNA polymerase sigma factor [Chitinophaga eiseniae]SKA45694.1 RNA polymerase sigma-70 factor, ECF subfamily [Chitinophaga eiseniae]